MCVVRPKCEIKSSLSLTTRILYVCAATGARSFDSPRLLRQVQVPKKTPQNITQTSDSPLLVVLINFVPQMPANAAVVCNPTGALPLSMCSILSYTSFVCKTLYCTRKKKTTTKAL